MRLGEPVGTAEALVETQDSLGLWTRGLRHRPGSVFQDVRDFSLAIIASQKYSYYSEPVRGPRISVRPDTCCSFWPALHSWQAP